VVIPFVEREYRADPSHRVLGGASLGGLFTLYAMYTNPTLFSAYIAVTPAVVVGNDWLLGYEEVFAKSGRPLPESRPTASATPACSSRPTRAVCASSSRRSRRRRGPPRGPERQGRMTGARRPDGTPLLRRHRRRGS
jgi:hypothetical protein